MLLPKNTNPSFSLYYYGAIVLRHLESVEDLYFDFLKLYYDVNAGEKISMQSFTLTLDWLYLIGSIKFSDEGRIQKCF
jgi:hypothetical protein